jgi:hypothetical protein
VVCAKFKPLSTNLEVQLLHAFSASLHLCSEETPLSMLVMPRYMPRIQLPCAWSFVVSKYLHFLARMSCLFSHHQRKGQKCKYFLPPPAGRPLSHRARFLLPLPHPPRRYFPTAPDLPRRVGAQATHRREEPIEAGGAPRGNSAGDRAPEA